MNDLVLRTPVFAIYDLTRTALIPVAIPYYSVKYVAGRVSREEETGGEDS